MILLALLLNIAQAQTAAPWTTQSVETLPAMGNPTHRAIPLQIVVEAGTAWANRRTLLASLTKSANILAQCQISFGEIEVRTITLNPQTRARLLSGRPRRIAPTGQMLSADNELTEGDLSATKPVMFLLGARTFESSRAVAYNRSYVDSLISYFPEAERQLDMIIITEQHITNTQRPAAPSYSTMAHELVHIIGNIGHHVLPRNLMSSVETPGAQTGDLLADQCLAIQGYPH